MVALLGERFAPITSRIGFLRAGLAEVAEALTAWRRDLAQQDLGQPFEVVVEGTGPLEEALARVPPLTAPQVPRELLVQVGEEWTAYFNCWILGTDTFSTVAHLAEAGGWQTLRVACVPNTKKRFGAVMLVIYGPEPTDWLNRVRLIQLINDGGRWTFDLAGEVQPFEEVEAYGARLKRDRFTPEMLERYCQALGVDVFNAEAYGPKYVLIEKQNELVNARTVSLAERQAELGITPT